MFLKVLSGRFVAATIAALLTLIVPAATRAQPVSEQVARAIQLETKAVEAAKQGRPAEAEQLYKQSIALIEQALPDDPVLAGSLNNLGSFYIGQKRTAEATPLLERALSIYVSKLGDNNAQTATAINNLAGVYVSERKFDQAEALYRRALAATESILGPQHYAVAISLASLAQVKFFKNQFAEAETLLKQGLAVAEKSTGPESQLSVQLMDYMISVLKAQGREPEAQALLERANQIVAKGAKR